MTLFYIVLLILLGALFLVAEVVFLPGVSVGALMSAVCYGGAVFLAFTDFGSAGGFIVIAAIVLSSLVAMIFSLRAKTWRRLSLEQEIDSSSMSDPAAELTVGTRGIAVSRLAPMGKVDFGGRIYEAKSLDRFVDPRTEVEIIGFENFNVIVRTID